MKTLLQTLLVAGGSLYLLLASPVAIYGWLMYRGFGGVLTTGDRLLLGSPFLAAALVIGGIIWVRSDRARERETRRH